MRVTNWIANLLPRTRSGQTRRRVSAFTLPPAERLESRTLLAGVLGLSINSASETRLSFTSSPNSAATNGRTSFDGSANDGWKFSVSGGPKSINVSAIYAKYSVSYYDPHWTLDLYPAAGQDLGPGSFLDSFTDYYSSSTDAGLSFKNSNSGHFNGFNGEFHILEFDVNVDGSVRRLSVDFTQRYTAPYDLAAQTTIGKFRYNSSPIVSESAGPTATELTVTRDGDLSQPQVVQLSSGDPQIAGVPSEVTILAGEASIVVPIDVRNNQFANDATRVTFLATAPGWQAATQHLIVQDDDGPPALEAVILQDKISESAGSNAAVIVVSRNTDNSIPMTVTLANSDPTEISVITTVVIPAGKSSILVPIDAVDDTFLDGTRTVIVTASSGSLIRPVATLQVTDDATDEVRAITLEVSRESVTESDKPRAAQLIIRHNVETTNVFVVKLTSSVPDRLIPSVSEVVIPAGQREVRVDLTTIDDLIASTNVDVTITAAEDQFYFYPDPVEPALRGTSVVVNVIDNDAAAVDVSIDPLSSWFAFDSTPGSWVGQGLRNYYVSPVNGWTFSADGGNRVLQFGIDEVPAPGQYYGGNWNLELAAPAGRTLIPGLFENAVRFGFQNANQPGLTLSGNGRGNSSNSGFFKILDAKYAANGVPEFLNVTFTQFDEQNPANWTQGELLYRKNPVYELYEAPSRERRTLTVRRNTSADGPLVVMLHNPNPDLIGMPETVTIPSGASSVSVPFTIKDNHTLDGLRTVSVSATANGYQSGEDSANLIDDEIAGIVAAGGFDNLTSIAEGSQINVPISLSAKPTSDVVVSASLNSSGRVTLNRQEFVFTPDNWSTPQELIVSATENSYWDGNVVRALSMSVVSDRSDMAFRSVNALRRQFTVTDNEPAVPSLTASSMTLNGHPLLQWTAVPGARSYEVWINNVTTGKRQYELVTSTVSSYRPDAAFAAGTYRVWIRVTMPDGVSPWGVARDFQVLAIPVWLNVPGVDSQAESIRWSPIAGSSSYEVWITNLDTKARAYFETNLSSPQTSVPVRLPPANYAAFVRGKVGNVWTDWSDRFLFTVLRAPVGNVMASVTNNTLNASWSAVNGATSYEVLVRDGVGTLVSRFANINSTSYRGPASNGVKPLAPGVYGLTVVAYSGARAMTVPGAAKILYVTQAPNVRVTATFAGWDAIPAASGYSFRITKAGEASATWVKTTLTQVAFSTPLGLGKYTVEVFSHYPDGTVSNTSVNSIELFRPAVELLPFPEETADATPVISWNSVVWAEKYSVQVIKAGDVRPAFQGEVAGTSLLRVSTPLPNATYRVFVQALAADGSRSELGAGRSLRIGAPPATLTYSAGVLSWSSIAGATQYDLWINSDGPPPKIQIVREPNLTSQSYSLSLSLPKGKYSVWVRAKRAEAGAVYEGNWSATLKIEIT